MAVPARFSISIHFTSRENPIAQSIFSQCQEPTQAMSIPVGPCGFNLALTALEADLGFESGRLVDVEHRDIGSGFRVEATSGSSRQASCIARVRRKGWYKRVRVRVKG
jgi:hypothetical protein